MDEKRMLGLNELNLGAKLAKQVAKRVDAPVPSNDVLEQHFAVVAAPVPAADMQALAAAATFDSSTFFNLWDKYYPTVVSLLAWASWVIPGKTLVLIKSLLATANNDLFPFARVIFARPDLLRLCRLAVTSAEFLKKLLALLAEFEKQHPPAAA